MFNSSVSRWRNILCDEIVNAEVLMLNYSERCGDLNVILFVDTITFAIFDVDNILEDTSYVLF